MTYALDFETYFDKELSVTTLGAYGYFETLTLDQIYLVSVVAEDGRSLVCHPRDLDWSFMSGATIVVWNGGFEIQGLRRLRELGLPIPAPETYDLVDAADLACYVGLPRALKGAASVALGVTIDKGIRDVDMKGKGWNDMDPDLQERVKEYAIKDSDYTLQIWNKHKDQWPDNERLISKLSREWAADGIGADVEGMKEAAGKLKLTLWEAGNKLPWYNPDDPKSVPLSPKKLAEQCRDAGIPCPTSLAMDDEDCAKWEDQYGEQYPWVAAMRDYRRANALLKKIEAMATRVWGGRLRYEIKYFGAGMTGRWSGGGGINCQNISGKPLFTVNQREYLVAPEGKMFVVSDLSQIEPRVGAWLTKDSFSLGQLASGVSPYIVHARATMGLGLEDTWSKSDPRYRLGKARVLCVSGDTPVLTKRGYKQISKITIADIVWDGVEWVSHNGIHKSPIRPTLRIGETELTSDHLIFTGADTTEQAGAVVERPEAARLLRRESSCGSWNEVWFLGCLIAKLATEGAVQWASLCPLFVRRLLKRIQCRLGKPARRENRDVCALREHENPRGSMVKHMGTSS